MKENTALDDGGLGGAVLGTDLITARTLEKAVKENWPIPEKYRTAIVNRQVQIAIDPEQSARANTSAARCLVSMNAQNMEQAPLIQHNSINLTVSASEREAARALIMARASAEMEIDDSRPSTDTSELSG